MHENVDDVEDLADDEPDPVYGVPSLVVIEELTYGRGVFVTDVLIGNR